MSLLKSLVIILAILITLAIGLLGYGLVKQAKDPNWRLLSTPKNNKGEEIKLPPANPSTVEPWGEINLNLPTECWISNLKTDSHRLYLKISPIGECHRIVVIDSSTGRVLGSVKPNP